MAVTVLQNSPTVSVPVGTPFTVTLTPNGTIPGGTIATWEIDQPDGTTVTFAGFPTGQSMTFTPVAASKTAPVKVTATVKMLDGSVMSSIGYIWVTSTTLLGFSFAAA